MTGGRIAPSEAAGHQDRDSAVFQAVVTQGEEAALEGEAHQAGGKRNAAPVIRVCCVYGISFSASS